MAGRPGLRPELEVLAVRLDGQVPGEETAGVGAHGALGDGQHPVGGDLDQVGPGTDVVHHPVDRGDHAASGGERPPDALEARGLEGEVASTVGDRGVQQGDVGSVGLEEADGSERRVHLRVARVVRHRGAGQRSRGHGGQTPRRRLESLEEGQERPVLDLDLAPEVRTREVGVRRKAREHVAGVPGHHLVHEATAEEQGPQAGEAQHDQGEVGVPSPPVPDEVPGRRRPAGVVGHDVEGVAGTDEGHGLVERADLVGADPGRTGSVDGWAGHVGQASGPGRRIASRDDPLRSRRRPGRPHHPGPT